MSGFKWTDRHGAEHPLEAPEAIDLEVDAIAAEIDAAFEKARSAPPAEEAELRDELRSHFNRLAELNADSERWNAYAFQQAEREAEELAAEIEKLIKEALPIMAVAELHNERLEESASEAAGSKLSAEPATDVQVFAISISEREPKPGDGLTRGEARDWLLADPVFARPLDDEGGWFEWRDKEGCAHRLASPLQIEVEITKLLDNLFELAPALTESKSLNTISRAILAANEDLLRISVLQVNLEKFYVEQAEREDKEWKACEKDWRQQRSKRE